MKRFKYYKPFWDKELKESWLVMNKAKKEKSLDFKQVRNRFDRLLCRKERNFDFEKIIKIGRANTENPWEFWQHTNKYK